MVVRRLATTALVLTLPATVAAQSVPPEMAPAPDLLLAQNGEPVGVGPRTAQDDPGEERQAGEGAGRHAAHSTRFLCRRSHPL